jgi:succinate-semialdehyde dehydrogenase/glutarate-semialdehyde dehydrogenase
MATLTEAPAATLPTRHSIVNGRDETGTAGVRAAVSPSDGQAFAQASLLSAAQAGAAVEAARAAFPAWSARPIRERAAVLLKARQVLVERADEIASLIAREQGKPAAEAHTADILPALDALKHLAQHSEEALREEPVESGVLVMAHKEGRLLQVPYGVVLVISPWNYPLSLPLICSATALVAGNAVVLKPAPATTLLGLEVGEIFRKAGLPAGVLNVVATDDTVAGALVEDPRIGKIVFTGSVATGKKVMAAAAKNLTPVVLELGGKDAAVVCRDADLDLAAQGIVWGAFLNAGQTCASVERVYVEAPVAQEFVAKVVERARAVRHGDPAKADTDMGPLTLERQRRIVEDHVADAVAHGAKVETGGQAPSGPGWYYPPTVLTNVTHQMRIMREETFGPVLPVMAVADVDEAVRLANESEYGLTASGWTRSAETAAKLQRELQAGAVTINDCISSFGEPAAPWGGFKQSGIGRTHGVAGLREMVQLKYVTRDPARQPKLWWYPYGEDLRRLMGAAVTALHARSAWARLKANLVLVGSSRFRRRAGVARVAQNIDKML